MYWESKFGLKECEDPHVFNTRGPKHLETFLLILIPLQTIYSDKASHILHIYKLNLVHKKFVHNDKYNSNTPLKKSGYISGYILPFCINSTLVKNILCLKCVIWSLRFNVGVCLYIKYGMIWCYNNYAFF